MYGSTADSVGITVYCVLQHGGLIQLIPVAPARQICRSIRKTIQSQQVLLPNLDRRRALVAPRAQPGQDQDELL